MRKELLWAGIIGIFFGLIIGFGVWRVRNSISNKVNNAPTPTPQAGIGKYTIALDKPESLGVVTEIPFTVSGITKPLTWVVVSTDNEDYLTQSSEDGIFETDVDLEPGINNILATAVSFFGETASQNILSVYSSSFETPAPEAEDTSSASDEADIKNEVSMKLEQAKNPPKAYIGTVTDIVDSTIQIKSIENQIEQIATNKANVSVVDIKGTNNKSVKLTDIAIGDFIAALGYVDGNEVLDAQRILITDALEENKLEIVLGKVTATTTKSITISPVSGDEEITITPGKNTQISSFTDGNFKSIRLTSISESERVIIVNDISGTPTITRSIFDLGEE